MKYYNESLGQCPNHPKRLSWNKNFISHIFCSASKVFLKVLKEGYKSFLGHHKEEWKEKTMLIFPFVLGFGKLSVKSALQNKIAVFWFLCFEC